MQVATGSVLIFWPTVYLTFDSNIWQCANFNSTQFQRFYLVDKTVLWRSLFTTSGSKKL